MHKGYYGEYSGNAKWSKDHAHTRVTKENYKAGDMKYDKEHHGSPARQELSNKDKRQLRRQARRTARKTKGDKQDIYYSLVSDKIEENKNK